ncbi:restriction endonuclease subunit S [Rhizobium mongolense]|uniref:restriction endonuclease subunit S n=1 Tax=Rhizobium mongolense TaxID=57676 RepID=UPI0035581A61
MNAERLLQHYEKIADAPDAIARLRRFILDLAVRGKLVPQDPEDEPAWQLLGAIRKKRQQQVDLGILRSAKDIALAPDHPFPFGAPEGWCWVLANDVWDFENGDRSKNYPSRDHFVSTGVPFVNAGHLVNEGVSFDDMNYITKSKFDCLSGGKLQQGDQIYCLRGSLGKHALYGFSRPAAIASSLVILRPVASNLVPYLRGYLNSDIASIMLKRFDNGTAQPNLSSANLRLFEIPLPPLAEQHRIIAKVDELMAICDQLEVARTEREAVRDRLAAASLARLNSPDPEMFRDDARFALEALPTLTARPNQIKQLRQTILNLAVRGKVVPQDPADEPAAELLKRLQERKAQARKPGIKIDLSATPHQIPKNWIWASLDQIIVFGPQNGISPRPSNRDDAPKAITLTATTSGVFNSDYFKRVEANIPKSSDYWLEDGDLLFQRGNTPEYVGMAAVYRGPSHSFLFPDLIIKVRMSKEVDLAFVHLASISPYARRYLTENASGAQATMPKINQTTLLSLPVPLPPLSEQRRIVAKVDELMALCDQLEASLATAGENRRKLLDALLADALAPADAVTLQEAAE